MSRLSGRIVAAARRVVGLAPRIVSMDVLDRRLRVIEGTLRSTADYDDAWFLASAFHAQCVFDVGANQGDMALLALLCPNVKSVVLVDPNPEALALAAQNLIRNRLSERARFLCAFASNHSGESIRFWTMGPGAAGSMFRTHAKTAARKGLFYEVPTLTVDEIRRSQGLDPDLVKIDVEGAENYVLEGSSDCATEGRTRFLVEMHSNPEMPMVPNTEMVLKWCERVGYAAWYLAAAERLTNAEPVKGRGRCHLLLQPSQWPYPDWLRGIPQSAPLSAVQRTSFRQ